MQKDTWEERKRGRKEVKKENQPLMTDAPKLPFVLRVRLDAQAGRQHELGDRGAEAGEEGVERLWFFVKKRGVSFYMLAMMLFGCCMWMGNVDSDAWTWNIGAPLPSFSPRSSQSYRPDQSPPSSPLLSSHHTSIHPTHDPSPNPKPQHKLQVAEDGAKKKKKKERKKKSHPHSSPRAHSTQTATPRPRPGIP